MEDLPLRLTVPGAGTGGAGGFTRGYVASSLMQRGPRWKECYIQPPEASHGEDTGICSTAARVYFNEIGPFPVNKRDNVGGAINTLVWHDWHAAVRHSENDGEAEEEIGLPALNKKPVSQR